MAILVVDFPWWSLLILMAVGDGWQLDVTKRVLNVKWGEGLAVEFGDKDKKPEAPE